METTKEEYVPVKRMFVGNLNFKTTEQDLEEHFKTSATSVSNVKILFDRDTNRSRGFGFVEVPEDEAKRVIQDLDKSDLDGRSINVSEAKPQEKRERGGRY